MGMERVCEIAERIAETFVKAIEAFKETIVGETFLEWATEYYAVEKCKNKRVKHLAWHGSTARIRKKNIKRAKEIYKHET